MSLTKLQTKARRMDTFSCVWSSPIVNGLHQVVKRVRDQIKSTKYRPQAVEDKQKHKATLKEKSQLLVRVKGPRAQNEQQHHQKRGNLQMKHRIVEYVIIVA